MVSRSEAFCSFLKGGKEDVIGKDLIAVNPSKLKVDMDETIKLGMA
ncbi:hypothetical protein [Priestia megaterium]|nr:hypothetical protein [Priestia megaterium]